MSFKQWCIISLSLDPTIGSEQGKTRPCLILSADYINDRLNTIVILPITSRKPGRNIYPNEVLLPVENSGLPNESIILINQVRTIDKSRIRKTYSSLDSSFIKEEIYEALDFNFDR
jgi:mRNA interferase MazF